MNSVNSYHLQPHPGHVDDRACPGCRHCCCKHPPTLLGTTFCADRTLPSAVSYNPHSYAYICLLLSWNRKFYNCRLAEQYTLHTTHLKQACFSFSSFFFPLPFLRALTDKQPNPCLEKRNRLPLLLIQRCNAKPYPSNSL